MHIKKNDFTIDFGREKQKDTRRRFLKWGMGALTPVLLPGIFRNRGSGSTEQLNKEPKHRCLDYARSFICNTEAFNSVRISLKTTNKIFAVQ